MANIKCNGNIETINLKSQSIDTTSIDIDVGIELGRKDGTQGTPYIDFHTDGSSSTDYNVRMLASGSQLDFLAADGLKINGFEIDAFEKLKKDGFIRFANGIQIYWGRVTDTTNRNSQKTYTINFDEPFIDNNYTIIATPQCTKTDGSYMYVMINIKTAAMTTTSADIYLAPTNSSSWHNGCFWLAIGRWKELEVENEGV